MSDFDEAFNDALEASFDEFFDSAIYDQTKKVTVLIHKNVVRFGGFDTTGSEPKHEIEFLSAEIPEPKRGQTIETDEGTFRLDGSISDDGFVTRWHINEA